MRTIYHLPLTTYRAIVVLMQLLLFGSIGLGQTITGDFVYVDCGCPGTTGPQVELTIHNGLVSPWGGQQITDIDEESKGAITIANLNDTDGDGTVDNVDDDVSATPKGRDELDLIALTVELLGTAAPTCDSVHFRLSSGLRLWEYSTKGTKIGTSIAVTDLPKQVFVEAFRPSNSVRDMEILAGLINEDGDTIKTDRTTITAIWAQHDTAYHALSQIPLPSSIGINEPNLISAIDRQYRGLDLNRYGFGRFEHLDNMGVNTGFDIRIGGRILHQFSLIPADLKSHLSSFGIELDITRRISKNNRYFNRRGVQYQITPFKTQNELSDDDTDNDDEDLIPSRRANLRIYSFDGPSSPRYNLSFAQERSLQFEEFVRVSFDNPISGNSLEGSACSEKKAWHLESSYVSSATRNPAFPHLDTDVLFEEIAPNATIAASRPRKSPIYSGTGTVNVTPFALRDSIADYYFLTANKDSSNQIQWTLEIAPSSSPASLTLVSTTNPSSTGPWNINTPEVAISIANDSSQPFVDKTLLLFVTFRPRRTDNLIED